VISQDGTGRRGDLWDGKGLCGDGTGQGVKEIIVWTGQFEERICRDGKVCRWD
jgi:hypothetical protein